MIEDLTQKPLHTLLLALADDEFILGYRNSEWTGIAPMLEEDVAFSSMAQDEIGHARLGQALGGGVAGVVGPAGEPPQADVYPILPVPARAARQIRRILATLLLTGVSFAP